MPPAKGSEHLSRDSGSELKRNSSPYTPGFKALLGARLAVLPARGGGVHEGHNVGIAGVRWWVPAASTDKADPHARAPHPPDWLFTSWPKQVPSVGEVLGDACKE